MPVLNDYRCKAHGIFEAFEPKCPHGCTGVVVEKVWLTAPSYQSQGTRNIHAMTKELAQNAGRSDVRQPYAGEAQPLPSQRIIDQASQQGFSHWQPMTNLGGYNLNPIRGERVGAPVGRDHVTPITSVTKVMRDPENLQVTK